MSSLMEHPYYKLNCFNAELCIPKFAVGKELGMVRWVEVLSRLRPKQTGNHNALQDAVYQAEMFRLVRELRLKA